MTAKQTLTPETLAERRRALGLNQSQLAARLGVGRVTLNRWENGVQPIPTELVDLALRGLETSGHADT